MALPAEKLAEIDEELAAFGKSDEELASVVGRAVALAAALAGDESLGSLLEGREEALLEARNAARDALPERPPEMPERPPIPEPSAMPVSAAPAADDEPDSDEVTGRELEAISSEAISREALGFDESEPPPAEVSDEPATPGQNIEDEFSREASADIAGLSVDELFADAAPEATDPRADSDFSELFDDDTGKAEPASEAPRLSDVDISDLFDDDEEIAGPSEPDASMESIEAAAPEPEPEPAAEALVAEALPAFEEEEESTMQVNLDDIEMLSDEFELLVDEDVLELDIDDGEAAPAMAADASEDGEDDSEGDEKRGLISRILGRK